MVNPVGRRVYVRLPTFCVSDYFGMWRDRTDLPDSPALARMLREQAWKRF